MQWQQVLSLRDEGYSTPTTLALRPCGSRHQAFRSYCSYSYSVSDHRFPTARQPGCHWLFYPLPTIHTPTPWPSAATRDAIFQLPPPRNEHSFMASQRIHNETPLVIWQLFHYVLNSIKRDPILYLSFVQEANTKTT